MCQVDIDFVKYNRPIFWTDPYKPLREISARLLLPPGRYVVIPTTFNKGEQGRFLVRVFTERHWGATRQADRHEHSESRNSVVNIPIECYHEHSGVLVESRGL